MIRLVLLAAALACAGCGPPILIASASLRAAHFGTSAYFDGQLEAAVVHPFELTTQAARTALEELEFEIVSDVERPNALYLRAKETGWREIKLSVYRKSPRVTKINMRIGILGDQAISRLILGRIFFLLGEGDAVEPEAILLPDAIPEAPRDLVPPLSGGEP